MYRKIKKRIEILQMWKKMMVEKWDKIFKENKKKIKPGNRKMGVMWNNRK